MPGLPPQSVQMLFCDVPYQVTRCVWDILIDQDLLWAAIEPMLVPSSAAVIMCSLQMVPDVIRASRIPYKYDLIYQKSIKTGFYNASKMPLREHEHMLVFGRGKPPYTPQKTASPTPSRVGLENSRGENKVYGQSPRKAYDRASERQPGSIVAIKQRDSDRRLHPTQKPVALLEWLIRTYTHPGDTILDPCAGSGTTAVAAIRTGRNAICIEKDAGYYDVMCKRIETEKRALGIA
jgi:site-specific DNA-methyltransferase (adenine-specific)